MISSVLSLRARGRQSAAALALVGVLLPLATRADDAETRLPIKPFAKAKVGDWAAIVMEHSSWTGVKPNSLTFVKLSVMEIKGDDVTIEASGQGGGTKTYRLKDAPTLADYVWLLRCDQKWGVGGVEAAKDTKTVGKKAFPCAKVSFRMEGERGSKNKCTLWLSPEVKGPSFVAWELQTVNEPKKGVSDLLYKVSAELVGYGSAEKTEWGSTAAEARAARTDTYKKLPVALDKLATGDWWVETGEVRKDTPADPGASKGVHYRVRLDGDKVKIEDVIWESLFAWEFNRKDGLTIQTFLTRDRQSDSGKRDHDDDTVTDYKVEDASVTLDGKKFDCKHVTCMHSSWSPSDRGERHVALYPEELWFSPSVRGIGFVKSGGYTLAGYGTAEKTEWGKTIDELNGKKKKDD